jgi:hypothetical protein
MVHVWTVRGYERVEAVMLDMANLLHAKVSFQQAVGKLTGPQMTTALIAYASPEPPAKADVVRRGEELVAAWKA